MRGTTKLLLVTAMTAGTVLAGAGVASAKGGPPTPGGATGTATCSVQASLSFSPALATGATGNSTVTLHANLTRCTASGLHRRTTGHLSANLGSIPTSTCTMPTSAPAFGTTGVNVRWTPGPHVKPSTVTSTATGTITTSTTTGKAQVAYSALTVAGSFPLSGTGTMTVTTNDTVADLQAQCTTSGSSLGSIGLRGSATL